MANLHVHSSVHFFHNIFNIGIIIRPDYVALANGVRKSCDE
jgi:hypothetical protein